ncbi:MAG: replicative DNA helicase [Oscillospiraceae bacterium]|jgi:replicative DNA helicase|nr:replicative DNA helicase [Oscillospiraceae bacterium]
MPADSFFHLDSQNLPYSLEAEQAVLGSVLIDPPSIFRVADVLRADYFYLPQHSAVYASMAGLFELNRKLDTVTVLEELRKTGAYDEAGGKAYLLQLAQLRPSAANIESYAEIVREKHYLRSLIAASRDIIAEATAEETDAARLLDSAEQRIFEIRQGRDVSGLKHIGDVLMGETLDRLDKLTSPEHRDEYIGIPTGLSGLDRMLTGLNKSDLIIVGARPGMGKTSFVLNIAKNVAQKQKKTVCIFSLEMTRDQLAQRLLSDAASIQSEKLRTGELKPEEWSDLIAASGILGNCQIYLDETSGITVQQMKAKLRRMKRVDLVVVDYLQLMQTAKPKDNRVAEVTEITRNLKIMAKELNVPVLVCAQLSRAPEKNGGKSHRPQLSDLRESGSIEQDADIVLFLYREFYYKNTAEDLEDINENAAECIVSKNRHGETGTVEMHWDGRFTRFTEEEHHYD